MTPLLPLEDFRRVIGYHPWHFWQLSDATHVPVTSACNTLVRQYAWQDANQAGRAEILEAIETAEARLRDYLGYPVAPQWHVETIPWQRFYNRGQIRRLNWDPAGHYLAEKLPDARILAVGAESLTLIGTVTTGGGSLVFSDQDGDGLNDTWTATIATTVTDPDRVHVYFAAADRLDAESANERWRVKPVKVTLAGGVATLIGRAWLVVKPVLYQGTAAAAIDPTAAANFASTLEIYEHKTDPDGITVDTAQATLVWETVPCHGWWCACGSCAVGTTYTPANGSEDPAAYAAAIARVGLRDARNGYVSPAEAVWNSSAGVFQHVPWDLWREPDRVIVRYQAGEPYQDGDVARSWQTIVARMAAAELAGRPCACAEANRELGRWQFDLARSSGANDESYGLVTRELLNNPFGTRRGHVYAWQAVRQLQSVTALTV